MVALTSAVAVVVGEVVVAASESPQPPAAGWLMLIMSVGAAMAASLPSCSPLSAAPVLVPGVLAGTLSVAGCRCEWLCTDCDVGAAPD